MSPALDWPLAVVGRHKLAVQAGIFAKRLSFFGASGACSIEFGRFLPMFPLDAARYRRPIHPGLPQVSVGQSPQLSKCAVSGLNAPVSLPRSPTAVSTRGPV